MRGSRARATAAPRGPSGSVSRCAGIGALAPLAGSLRELDLSYCYALRGLSLDVLPQLRLLNLHW